MRSPLLAAALAGMAASAGAGVPRAAHAQAPPPAPMRAAPELRADAILGSRPAVQLGAGVQIPVGYYVRVGLVGAVGARIDDDPGPPEGSRLDGRADLLVRFLLDPFRQTRYGLSVGGGLSARVEPGDRVRPLLLVAAELEGTRGASGWVPALQVGLGGGTRVGVLLRRGAAGAR